MASSYENYNEGPDPNLKPSTTYVQADLSNFRAIVQKLTGATTFQQSIFIPTRHSKKPTLYKVSGEKSGHKLYERRKSRTKLEITMSKVVRPTARETVTVSPVSTLDVCGRQSAWMPVKEEEIAITIAEKGFYLHPSPIKGSKPELLVLFPLNSPKRDLS